MNIPKTLSGLALLLAGAGANAVPFLQVLSPYLISTGIGVLSIGVGAKVNRAIKKQDVFKNEREILTKMKGKKMNFMDVLKRTARSIKEGNFNIWDIIVPLLIQAGVELGRKALNGEKLNDEFKGVVKLAYYASIEFEDNLVKNPDEEFTDEALKGMREIFSNAAIEGDFPLDIPTQNP